MRETETVSEFRAEVEKKYGVPQGSFLISKVHENLIKRLFDTNSKVEDVLSQEGVILLYEIPPTLQPNLPPRERCSKSDSNHGIAPEEWTKCVMNFL